GAHTSSMGLAFYESQLLPERYPNGAFIGQHGPWNRKPGRGYKVIFVPFQSGKPDGPPEASLTGFVSADEKALRHPVGGSVDRSGALLRTEEAGDVTCRRTQDAEFGGPPNQREPRCRTALRRRAPHAVCPYRDARPNRIMPGKGGQRVDLGCRSHRLEAGQS